MLQEPTRGVDVGAKLEIHRIIRDLAGKGLVTVLASSDLPELMGMCDRILVMRAGRPAGIFDPSVTTAKRSAWRCWRIPRGRRRAHEDRKRPDPAAT